MMSSDIAVQVTSKVMGELFGTDKVVTTAYCPRSNGVVERLHGTLVPLRRP